MTHEAIPTAISDSPDLMRQFVLGQLPPTGTFPGRIVKDPATNIADLVGWVEGGYLSIETINRVLSDDEAIRRGLHVPGGHAAHDVGVAVSAEIQRRHAAQVAAAGAAQLEADNVGVAWVLGGIDDVPAAIAHLAPKGKKAAIEWELRGDELYVRGVSCEQVAAALHATRPSPGK